MTSLFISHSSPDRGAAERVRDDLLDAGFVNLFLDVDPDQGIATGANWEREIYARLRMADAVLFLGSPASLESKWCFAELAIARSVGKPIVPIVITEPGRHPLLTDTQAMELEIGEPQATRQLFKHLARHGLDPEDALGWDATRSPYPGLEPFDEQDAGVFFGREREIKALMEKLHSKVRQGGWVCVFGPSGSGKSSLVRAGLIPRLRRHADWLIVPPLTPKGDPFRNLARSLTAAAGGGLATIEVWNRLKEDGASALIDLVERLRDANPPATSLLLVVDQAEELVTTVGPEQRGEFLSLLDGLGGNGDGIWVIATLRSEFVTASPDYADLVGIVDDWLPVGALDRSRLAEVIERPATRAGLTFDEGLIARIVEETRGGDALPLLGYTLRQLADNARDGHISVSDYEAIGGVGGAVRHVADQILEAFQGEERGDVIAPLLKLVTISDNQEPTRRRTSLARFSDRERAILQPFIDARLLTVSGERDEPAAFVEVAHEALLRQWPPLQEAIDVRRDDVRIRSEVERLARDWDNAGRQESYLLRGTRLAQAERLAELDASPFDPPAGEFVAASQDLAERERQEATKRQERRRVQEQATQVLALLPVRPVEGLALAVATIGRSLDALPGEPMAPALAGLHTALGVAREREVLAAHSATVMTVAFAPDGQELLSAGLDRTLRLWTLGEPRGGRLLARHDDDVTAVACSPDGQTIASASADQTVRLWARSGALLRELPHGKRVTAVAWSPDGAAIVSASADRTLRLWDRDGRQLGPPLTGHDDDITAVAWSPDGTTIVSASADRTLRLWDRDGRQLGRPFAGHERTITAVAWSPDGTTIVSASADRTVRLWSLQGEQADDPLIGHEGAVTAVTFSPDGDLIATGSADRTVRLWQRRGHAASQLLVGHTADINGIVLPAGAETIVTGSSDGTLRRWDWNGAPIGPAWRGHSGFVMAVAISPDGTTIASGGNDGTVRLWDSHGEVIGVPFTAHRAGVGALAFTPDRATLVSGGADGSLRRWDLDGRPLTPPFAGHTDRVSSVAVTGDGTSVVSGSVDRTLRRWDLDGSPLGEPFRGHEHEVVAIALSPDGTLVASASADRTLRLWSLEGAQVQRPFRGHRDGVYAVAFAPDGQTIASGSGDETVRLWDLEGNAISQPLRGHKDGIGEVKFAPSGSVLLSGSADGEVRIWRQCTWRSWLQAACERLSANPLLRSDTELARTALDACRRYGSA